MKIFLCGEVWMKEFLICIHFCCVSKQRTDGKSEIFHHAKTMYNAPYYPQTRIYRTAIQVPELFVLSPHFPLQSMFHTTSGSDDSSSIVEVKIIKVL